MLRLSPRFSTLLALPSSEIPVNSVSNLTAADRMICHCLQVKESQVADTVTIYGAASLKDVVRGCGAGGGCNSCHARIRRMIEDHATT